MRSKLRFILTLLIACLSCDLYASAHHSGATLGKFQVDSRGSANYSINLDVPPGTAGMQPSLSLNYSSYGGNGYLGLGWSLSGLSVITRCGQSYAQDGDKLGVNFTSTDRYCLNGQRLVAISGSYGQSGAEYRLQNDNTFRIKSYGQAGSGPASFKVWTKSGQIMEFGLVESGIDSRIEASNRTDNSVIIWALGRVSDTATNYITFDYYENTATGEHYLTRINYAGNENKGISPYAKVEINYETRSDDSLKYLAGSKISMTKRINSIKTITGGVTVKNYKLSYEYTTDIARSQIISLSECDISNDCKLSTNFNWKSHTGITPTNPEMIMSHIQETSHLFYTNSGNEDRLIDINGDGKSDLVWRPRDTNEIWVALSNGNGFKTPKKWLQNGDGGIPNVFSYTSAAHESFDDVDGDGLPDFILIPAGSQHVWVARSNGTGFHAPEIWLHHGDGGAPYLFASVVGQAAYTDLNGDGRADKVWKPHNSFDVWAALSTGDRFDTPQIWSRHSDGGVPYLFSNLGIHEAFIDINGDGKSDHVWMPHTTQDIWVTYSTGESFGDPELLLANGAGGSPYLFSGDGLRETYTDVNGDGLNDYVWLPHTSQDIWVALANGKGLNVPTKWMSHGAGGAPYLFSLNARHEYFSDINTDGLTDRVWIAQDTQDLWISYSNGKYFETPKRWLRNGDAGSAYLFSADGLAQTLSDVNGDGVPDWVWIPLRLNDVWISFGDFKLPPVINSVTDGLGESISIDYSPLTDSSTYTKGISNNYPILNVQSSSYVISEYTQSNGTHAPYRYTYHYEDLKTHLLGSGSLGFKTIIQTDPQKNVSATTTYLQGLTQFQNASPLLDASGYPAIDQTQGKTSLVETRLSTGRLLDRMQASWESHALTSPSDTNKRFIVHKTSTVDEAYDLNDGALVTRASTNYTFENEGTATDYSNVTQLSLTHKDGYTQSTTSTYDNTITTDQWFLGRLRIATATNTNQYGDSASRTSAFEYDYTTGLLIKEIEQYQHATLEKTTAYQRDDYGNITLTTVSAPGISSRSITTAFDARGQFPISTTNALNHQETYTYDTKWGVKKTLTGPNNLTTTWDYDSLGRLIKESRADGTYTTTTYGLCGAGASCDHGSPLWITSQDYGTNQATMSAPSTIYFDPQGREVRTSTIGYQGREIEKITQYDTFGRAYRISQEHYVGLNNYGWTVYNFDLTGRVTKETKPDSTFTTITYDGLSTTFINHKGQRKTEIKDARGKMIQVTDAMNGVSTYDYDPFGNLTGTVDNDGNVTTMKYDNAGNKSSMSDLDMGDWVYGYNALGELRCQRDAKNKRAGDTNCLDDVNNANGPFTTFIIYDQLGRMVTREEKEGVSTWTYDTSPTKGEGKLHISVSASGVTEIHTYDPYGRPLSTETTIDSETMVASIGYDTVTARIKSNTYPSGLSVHHVYDSYGHLIELNKNGNRTDYFWQLIEMTATGKVTDERFGNGVTTTTQYNTLNERVEGIMTGLGGASGNVQHLTYGYDEIGNITRRSDNLASLTETFDFDALNRLTASTVGSQINRVEYDSIGNITFKTGVGYYEYNCADSPHAVSKAGDTYYGYDANGNMIAGDGRSLSYTSFNKPHVITKGGTRNDYTYDADHERIKKVSAKDGKITTTYYLGKTYEKLYLPSSVQQQKHYLSAGSATLLYTKSSNAPDKQEYLHKDHLGSTDVITSTDGNGLAVIVSSSRSSFDAWGARRNANWSDTGNFGLNIASLVTRGFTGHEHDDEIGLINMNARMYDAKLGRFLSPDTIVQFPYTTQGMNRYTYVNNNPVSYTDPSGHELVALIIEVVIQAVINYAVSEAIQAIANGNQDIAEALDIAWTLYNLFDTFDSAVNKEMPPPNVDSMQFGNMYVPTQDTTPLIKIDYKRMVVSSITYGLIEHWGGGKFANGARSGAFGSLAGSFDLQKNSSPWIMHSNNPNDHWSCDEFGDCGPQNQTIADEVFWFTVTLPVGGPAGGSVIKGAKEFIKWVFTRGATKNVDKWSRVPRSIQDQMTLDAAKKGAGTRIRENLGDPKFKGMEKWEYKVKSKNGQDSVVHYVRNPKTGKLMDFKFNKHSTHHPKPWGND